MHKPETLEDGLEQRPLSASVERLRDWWRSLLFSAVAAVGLSGPLPGQEQMPQAKPRSPTPYDALIEQLNDQRYLVREEAQKALLKIGVSKVQETKKPFAGKHHLRPHPFHTAEQIRRLEKVFAGIEDEEMIADFLSPSVFHAPADWHEDGRLVSVDTLLKTLASSTAQPLSLRYSQIQFLERQIPTVGLDGKTFWEIMNHLKMDDGAPPTITTNSQGMLFVRSNEELHPSLRASAGPLCGLLKQLPGVPGKAFIQFESEPKFKLGSWDILSTHVTSSDGKKHSALRNTYKGMGVENMCIALPSGLPPNDVVTFTICGNFTAFHSKTVAIQSLDTEQEFIALDYRACYRKTTKDNDGRFAVEFDLLPGRYGFNFGVRDRFGCTAIGQDGLPMIPLSQDQPSGTQEGRFKWVFPGEPSTVQFHLPGFSLVTARHTIVFPDVTLE